MTSAGTRRFKARSGALVSLGHRIARKHLAVTATFDTHSNEGLGGCARRAKDGNCSEGFVIELRNQEGFPGADFFPYLPDLDAFRCRLI